MLPGAHQEIAGNMCVARSISAKRVGELIGIPATIRSGAAFAGTTGSFVASTNERPAFRILRVAEVAGESAAGSAGDSAHTAATAACAPELLHPRSGWPATQRGRTIALVGAG